MRSAIRRWSGSRSRSKSRSGSKSRSRSRSRSRSWSWRDRVRRWITEGGLEDRDKARCGYVSWEVDNIAEGLQAGAEEEKNALFEAVWDWVGHKHRQTAENLKTTMVKSRAKVTILKKCVYSTEGLNSCVLLLSM